eukprot:13499451-Alexandrium_andersonii.AAC.1
MSASLVGSEMCIRDSHACARPLQLMDLRAATALTAGLDQPSAFLGKEVVGRRLAEVAAFEQPARRNLGPR